ncbi:MAG: rhomboid family intramembrane serine protease [Akkermansiaceae bacterium]|nr:rhomboid family intramembrane serine protease [Akkermansiaceae bacterium]
MIFILQSLLGPLFYFPWMVVPVEVESSLANLLHGDAAAGDGRVMTTLLSYAFLHADLAHVAMNMLFFWIFGALLVELLGWRWMLMIFVVTAVAGAISHILMNRGDTVPMLGASGAVMGFEGAYLALAVRWTLPDPHVWPIARPIPPGHLALVALLGVGVDYFSIMAGSQCGTAYGAHVGGFTAGLLFAGLAAPRPRGRGVMRR